jgi:hypothetical protein
MVSPLAAMPEASRTAADRASREDEARSSLTQQLISQPKKLMGSWGMLSRKSDSSQYINGMKAVFSPRSCVFAVEVDKTQRNPEVE